MSNTNLSNIPRELKRLDRWVFTDETLDIDDDPKHPYTPLFCSPASVVNKLDWGSFDELLFELKRRREAYAGFIFSNDGYVGVDIDHAIDSDGDVSETALEIIDLCKSYTEVSRSGTGIHIIVKGSLPFDGANNRNGLEIYKNKRFFVLTGNRISKSSVIVTNQVAIDTIVSKFFKEATISDSSNTSRKSRIWKSHWVYEGGHIIPLEPIFDSVESGSRHLCLVSWCGQKHSAGCPSDQLLEIAKEANDALLNPPLPLAEVKQIVKSIIKYRR